MSRPNPISVVHNAYTPKEAIEISSRAGSHKAHMRIDKVILSSFMAGALLSFAGACYVTINTAPWYQENAPGLIKMFGALVFPFGLVVIVMTGADLATGSFMVRTLHPLPSPSVTQEKARQIGKKRHPREHEQLTQENTVHHPFHPPPPHHSPPNATPLGPYLPG